MINTEKINRFEIIDHTPCSHCKGKGTINKKECEHCRGIGCQGRRVIMWDDNEQIDIDVQDDDRTLKVFIHDRYEK